MPDQADSTQLLLIPEITQFPLFEQLLQRFEMVLIDRLPRHGGIRGELFRELLVSVPPLLGEFAPAFHGHTIHRESDTRRERRSGIVESRMSLSVQLIHNGSAPVDACTEDIEEQSTRSW